MLIPCIACIDTGRYHTLCFRPASQSTPHLTSTLFERRQHLLQGSLLCLPLNHICATFSGLYSSASTFRLEAEKLVRHCDHQGVRKIQQLQGLCQLQGLEQLYHLPYSRIMGSLHRRGQTNRDRAFILNHQPGALV